MAAGIKKRSAGVKKGGESQKKGYYRADIKEVAKTAGFTFPVELRFLFSFDSFRSNQSSPGVIEEFTQAEDGESQRQQEQCLADMSGQPEVQDKDGQCRSQCKCH